MNRTTAYLAVLALASPMLTWSLDLSIASPIPQEVITGPNLSISGKSAPGAMILVRGQQVLADAQGDFSLSIGAPKKEGTYPLNVEAVLGSDTARSEVLFQVALATPTVDSVPVDSVAAMPVEAAAETSAPVLAPKPEEAPTATAPAPENVVSSDMAASAGPSWQFGVSVQNATITTNPGTYVWLIEASVLHRLLMDKLAVGPSVTIPLGKYVSGGGAEAIVAYDLFRIGKTFGLQSRLGLGFVEMNRSTLSGYYWAANRVATLGLKLDASYASLLGQVGYATYQNGSPDEEIHNTHGLTWSLGFGMNLRI